MCRLVCFGTDSWCLVVSCRQVLYGIVLSPCCVKLCKERFPFRRQVMNGNVCDVGSSVVARSCSVPNRRLVAWGRESSR
jgi:hypothetical protein